MRDDYGWLLSIMISRSYLHLYFKFRNLPLRFHLVYLVELYYQRGIANFIAPSLLERTKPVKETLLPLYINLQSHVFLIIRNLILLDSLNW